MSESDVEKALKEKLGYRKRVAVEGNLYEIVEISGSYLKLMLTDKDRLWCKVCSHESRGVGREDPCTGCEHR